MPDIVVYEATGIFHRALECCLSGKLPLVKVNPLQTRRFAQARGTRVKTDILDAQMLATMGASFNLSPDEPIDRNQHVLKELQVARTALIKERTRLKNRAKTQTLPLPQRQPKARLDQIARQLAQLEEALLDQIKQSPKKARAFDILCSIAGLGPVTAMTILVECPEIGTITGDRIPCWPCPHAPAIGAMARQVIHSGRAEIPARCSLHAGTRLLTLQS